MSNRILRLRNPVEAQVYWDFFLEGMQILVNPKGANAKYTPESFFKLICNVQAMGDKGLVVLVTNADSKPLGFCIAFEALTFMGDKCLFLVEVYSNGECNRTTKDGLAYVEQYARSLGLNEIKTATRRFSGSSLRLFEDRWGFTREYQTFTKQLAN